MVSFPPGLHASEAARRLGVSTKALRLYEQQGLVLPGRTASGYRMYRPQDMLRAEEVVSLRALGLSLAQVARVFNGDDESLRAALNTHSAALDAEIRGIVSKLDRVRAIQSDLAQGRMPARGELKSALHGPETNVAFDLPWPWGGERFELRDIRPLNYIIGSLGSGKTRFAMCLAEALPDAAFLGLDRSGNDRAAAAVSSNADAALRSRVDQALSWLLDEGAEASSTLTALLVSLEADKPSSLVVDLIEQGLEACTQSALSTYLRKRAKWADRTLFLMTRSSAILDLAAAGPDEAIILCPANHSPPTRVAPYPGAPGYEAVATCLASPDVRKRVAHPPETLSIP